MKQEPIAVTILTGFLGAGKTTLLRHILNTAKDKQLALMINEFGEVGVDGALMRECADTNCPEQNMIELANGCICCTVADDFMPAIQQLLERDPKPDHIIIETSGLALPQPLVQAFQWPGIKGKIKLDAVLTLIDAPAVLDGVFAEDIEAVNALRQADEALDHDQPIVELFEDQLAAANVILLGKADRLNQEQLDKVKTELKTHRPDSVVMIDIHHGKANIKALLGLGLEEQAIKRANAPYHHQGEDDHDHDEFSTLIIEMPPISDPIQFGETVKQTMQTHQLLRIKGYLKVEGKPMPFIVQAVGSHYEGYYATKPDASKQVNALVVIAEGERDGNAIAASLGGKFKG